MGLSRQVSHSVHWQLLTFQPALKACSISSGGGGVIGRIPLQIKLATKRLSIQTKCSHLHGNIPKCNVSRPRAAPSGGVLPFKDAVYIPNFIFSTQGPTGDTNRTFPPANQSAPPLVTAVGEHTDYLLGGGKRTFKGRHVRWSLRRFYS